MFDYLQFSDIEGTRSANDLLIFTLSTCSFCAEALQFLRDEGFRFRWVVTDELPLDTRRRLRNDFIRIFKERMYYPVLVIDGKRVLTGFEVEEWRRELEGKDH